MKKLEKLKRNQKISEQSNKNTTLSCRMIVTGETVDRILGTRPFSTTTNIDTGWFLNWDFESHPDILYGDWFNTGIGSFA